MLPPVLLFLLACDGGPDTPDPKDDTGTVGDSGDTGTPDDTGAAPSTALGDAYATVHGSESYAVGNAVAFAGDDDGEGRDAAVIAASFYGSVCLVRGPPAPGPTHFDATDLCWTPEVDRDYAGTALDGGRDVTGDGVPDVLVGAIANDEVGPEAGKAYVLAGPHLGGSLADATAHLLGESKGDYAGTTTVLLGDIDGDGQGDLLVGAPSNEGGGSGAGRAYLFRGPVSAGTWGLGQAWATITGEGPAAELAGEPPHGAPAAGDGVGSVACAAGDFDGDGLADLFLGANGNELGGSDAGAGALFLGPLGEGDHALADADQLWIGASDLQYVGDQAAGPGDLDNDGLTDLMLSGDTNGAGTIWLIHGPGVAGTTRVDALPTRLEGEAVGDLAGAYMAPAGDVDGDGWRDMLISAYANDAAGEDAGAVYLVRGPVSEGVTPLSDAAWAWRGRDQADQAGRAVAGGGDLDGDARPDVLVGAPYADHDGAYAGEAYLLLGI
jgi:hypothetical protein